MSNKHPIIAVTGSSGAGTTTVKVAMQHIFRRNGYTAAIIEGDSFHKYEREEMKDALHEAYDKGEVLSHFGPGGNEFGLLEELFRVYGETGTGKSRKYLHNDEEAIPYNQKPGTFSPWENIEPGTDMMFYEGLHGGIVDGKINVAKHVNLLIGVPPIVNLEWIQKIHRDTHERGYSEEIVTNTILRRMCDYVHYMTMTPQYSRTHINFQRVPTVDTSNPFIARDIPTLDESFVVIRFGTELQDKVDYPFMLQMIQGSFMSRKNSIVVPGGKMGFAMEMILQPLITNLIEKGVLEWTI